jgi:hypothetical protein
MVAQVTDGSRIMKLVRRVLAVGVAIALAVPATAAAAPLPRHSHLAPNAQQHRAAVAYAALQQWFAADDGSGLYHEQYPVEPGDNAYSYEWPFSQAHVAALDLTAMKHSGRGYTAALRQHDQAQLNYWHDAGSTGLPGFASGAEPPYGSGGDFFYDDNEWVGLQDVQHYAFFHDRRSVRQAEQIFALVKSGWDTDSSHADPGGVFWTQAAWSTDRNTVSNMPAAELGLRLFQITGKQTYLTWALKMYRWTNQHLQRPDGLYWDHLDLQGNVEKTIWSYNQGVPVGVNVLLYRVTGNRKYLAEAKRVAAASYDYYVTGGQLTTQPPFFNSIYFKNLLLLESTTGGTKYRHAMQNYADLIWSTQRDASTGLFHFAANDDPHTQMIEQAAMVQIYAVLAWRNSDYRRLY